MFWQNVKNGRYSITEARVDRWDPALYYDADPKAPNKTYSKIGGWVRDWEWDSAQMALPIPPRVKPWDGLDSEVGCSLRARETLADFGYPSRSRRP